MIDLARGAAEPMGDPASPKGAAPECATKVKSEPEFFAEIKSPHLRIVDDIVGAALHQNLA